MIVVLQQVESKREDDGEAFIYLIQMMGMHVIYEYLLCGV